MNGEKVEFARDAYDKKLAIIVPYRDRLSHLKRFIPHMDAYFSRDKLDRRLAVDLFIIEQFGKDDFNRGLLKNVGAVLARDGCDYLCFHDVDYLPIWADYSYTQNPTRLIWYGLTLKEDYESFFGGVVAMDKGQFFSVNGYPNCYWGWGPEDLELGMRFHLQGMRFQKRDGTFESLPHTHHGFTAMGKYSAEAERTHNIFRGREEKISTFIETDGVSQASFELIETNQIRIAGRVKDGWKHFLVKIK